MNEVKVNHIYKHFKGDLYLVEDIAIHSDTGERYVAYRALYGNHTLYVRPYEAFIAKLDRREHPDAKQTYRFELQNIKSVRD